MSGWIKLHRKLLDWEWYQDHNTKIVFLHLLLTANHKDSRWMGHTITRGQVVIGRKALAKTLALTEREIRTSLTKLKTTSELTIKTTNKFSIVTINNFDDYQDPNDQQNDQQNDQPATNKRPANDHKQEVKNERKENTTRGQAPKSTFQKPTLDEIKTYLHEKNSSVDPEAFYAFYESNGWKVGNNPMRSWHAAITTWEKRNNPHFTPTETTSSYMTHEQHQTFLQEIGAMPSPTIPLHPSKNSPK